MWGVGSLARFVGDKLFFAPNLTMWLRKSEGFPVKYGAGPHRCFLVAYTRYLDPIHVRLGPRSLRDRIYTYLYKSHS